MAFHFLRGGGRLIIVNSYLNSSGAQSGPSSGNNRAYPNTNGLDEPGLLMCAPKKILFGKVPWDSGPSVAGVPAEITTFKNAYIAKNQRYWYRANDPIMHMKYLYGFNTGNKTIQTRTYSSGSVALSSRIYFTGLGATTLQAEYDVATGFGFYRQKICD